MDTIKDILLSLLKVLKDVLCFLGILFLLLYFLFGHNGPSFRSYEEAAPVENF